MNVRRALAVAGALTLVATVAAPAIAAPPRLRLNGIGPLKFGMTVAQAQATGWIANRTPGCELQSPRPVGYDLTGPSAPAGLRGDVTFVRGKLVNVAVDKGATTITNVRPGVTTAARMARAYRQAGYWVTSDYEPVFQARFITATRGGKTIVGIAPGFSTAKVVTSLSVPFANVCE